MRAVVLLLGWTELALGMFMACAPGTYFTVLGAFGPRNDHYVRDLATWSLALAVAAFLAAGRPRWRTPVVVITVAHFALHTLNHIIDVDGATPAWLGPADLAALAAATVMLAWFLRHADGSA